MWIDVNKYIPDPVRKEIDRRLSAIEKDYSVTILYACESGSRSWGFASPDSDYDIRFLYAHPRDWYLSVFDQRDVIEPGIEEEEVVYDPGGWDIRKAFALLRGANGPLIEWLNAPIVYRSTDAVRFIRELQPKVFLPRNAAYHYAAMARKLFKDVRESKKVKLKRYFYILRATLCARYIVDHGEAPPVLFYDLFREYLAKSTLGSKVEEMIELKARQNEKDRIKRIVELEEYIDATLADVNENMPGVMDKAEKSLFNQAFLKTLEAVEKSN